MPPPPLRRPFSTRLPPSLGPSPSRRARPLRRRCRSRGRQAVAMALALQLRRALAAASTAAPLLHVPASVARSLSLTPSSASSVAPPLPRAPWWLRAGFRSTAARCRSDYGADVSNISPDEILFEGRDHNHSPWSFPTSRPSPRSSEDMDPLAPLGNVTNVARGGERVLKRRREDSQGIFNTVPYDQISQDIQTSVTHQELLQHRRQRSLKRDARD